ncbi:MAG: dihydroorotase [Acutalibacteraceae bacterium]|nr:dihydroorotase [Acutalibacteraceae bacterium]
MNLTLKDVHFFKGNAFQSGTYSLNISDPSPSLFDFQGGIVSNFNNCFVLPAFCDVHVHLREPGFSYKETILSGSRASAKGGYTDICSMPNLKPVPDSVENIKVQQDIIDRDAVIRVHPYASITVNQEGKVLSDFDALRDKCFAFSDDGRGVQSPELMEQAMKKAKSLNKIIVAHCEDNSLLNGGYIHDGEYAKLHGHNGICSESEWGPIKRDIELAKKTGCKYHVCHISCKESVELIRQAKKEGVDITCETAPHYLVFNDMDLKDEGRFKMNPPIRSEADRLALIEGIKDGTIDMIATDHAPHSEEEKTKGLKLSNMGVVGIETAFSVMFTYLVKTNIISLEKLIELMSINPRKRFGLPQTDDICVFDLNTEYTVDPKDFLSKGKFTPFKGLKLFGVNKLTVCDGKIVYNSVF